MKDEVRPNSESLYTINKITEGYNCYSDQNMKVECMTVPHGVAKLRFAYKFLIVNKPIVFSGDTSKNDKLIKFPDNANYLIHEVLNLDGTNPIIKTTHPGNKIFKKHIVESHMSMDEVLEVASAPRAENLILNHLVPTASPMFDRKEIWEEGVSKKKDDNIIVGEDLLEIGI